MVYIYYALALSPVFEPVGVRKEEEPRYPRIVIGTKSKERMKTGNEYNIFMLWIQ